MSEIDTKMTKTLIVMIEELMGNNPDNLDDDDGYDFDELFKTK
jgi:hypothetical protein